MSHSALGYDYPAGAEHDPRAPWNQKDPVCEKCDNKQTIDCPECEGARGGCEECNNKEGKIDCPECQ